MRFALIGLACAGAAVLAPAHAAETIRPMIARHAAANNVPAALADAVVRIESRYKVHARNRANLGLTQISHRTARGIGYTGSAAGLFDADTNLRFGIKYLAMAYRKAGGDTCRTVMYYQSGLFAAPMNGANRAYCGKVRAILGGRGPRAS